MRSSISSARVADSLQYSPGTERLRFRAATGEDLSEIAVIFEAVCRDPETASHFVRRIGSADDLLDGWRESIYRILVAEDSDTLTGFTAWRQDEGVGVVDIVAARPEWQGRGVGRALLGRLVRDLRAEGLHVLEARLPDPGDAEVAGFREIGRLEGHSGCKWVHYQRRLVKKRMHGVGR